MPTSSDFVCPMCNGTGFQRIVGQNRVRRCSCRRERLPSSMAVWQEARLQTLDKGVAALSKGYPGRPLYITGPVGTGKTWAAVAIAREAGAPTLIWWPDWCARHRVLDHDSPNEAIGKLDAMIERRNLIIDDIGSETETGYGYRLLMRLFEPRRSTDLGTIVTGNYSVEELAERYDDRLASRLTESATVITVAGQDRRVA